MTDQAILRLDSIEKIFNSLRIIRGVSFAIQEGEFFSLLGPSGCGKTTLLRIIAGLESADGGTVWFRGKAIRPKQYPRQKITMVFQKFALFPHMTVFENVAFALRVRRESEALIQKRVADLIGLVDLDGLEERYPAQLSGGQQQRVAIARALAPEPEIVLFDEPLGALDLKLRQKMQIELKKLQRRLGTTFIYVTHDQDEALTLSDRMAVMDSGNLVQVGAPHDLYAQPSTLFVSEFIGDMNRFTGDVVSVERRNGGGSLVTLKIGNDTLVGENPNGAVFRPEQRAVLCVRPERMTVLKNKPRAASEDTSMLKALVVDEVFMGREKWLYLDSGETRFKLHVPVDSRFHADDHVHCVWKHGDACVFPFDDGARRAE